MFIKHKFIIYENYNINTIKVILINTTIRNHILTTNLTSKGLTYCRPISNLDYTEFDIWFNIPEDTDFFCISKDINNLSEIVDIFSSILKEEYNREELNHVITECINHYVEKN